MSIKYDYVKNVHEMYAFPSLPISILKSFSYTKFSDMIYKHISLIKQYNLQNTDSIKYID